MKTLAGKISSPLFLLILVFVYSGCDDGPAAHTPAELPFDNFGISAQFDGDPSTTSDEFFDTRLDVSNYPAGSSQVYYNYWETRETWGDGKVPDGCQVVYSRSAFEWTIIVKGEVPRRGVSDPGTTPPSVWPEMLKFEVNAVVNIKTLAVKSAVVRFPQFYQVIDFAASSQADNVSTNGREALQLTCDGVVEAGDLSLLKVSIQLAEIL